MEHLIGLFVDIQKVMGNKVPKADLTNRIQLLFIHENDLIREHLAFIVLSAVNFILKGGILKKGQFIKGSLDDAIPLLQAWAKETAIDLREQRKSSFNAYFHAVKSYDGKEHTLHVVASTLTEDPGNVHISFRSYEKPDVRKGAEDDVAKAEAKLWENGRKVEGETRQNIQEIISKKF